MADLRDINLKFSGAISDLIIDNPADLAKEVAEIHVGYKMRSRGRDFTKITCC